MGGEIVSGEPWFGCDAMQCIVLMGLSIAGDLSAKPVRSGNPQPQMMQMINVLAVRGF